MRAEPGKIDAPLPPKSTLTIGYGDSGVYPSASRLSKGQKKDVRFFKLFLFSSPTDISNIPQVSPFSSFARFSDNGPVVLGTPNVWATKLVAVVIVDS